MSDLEAIASRLYAAPSPQATTPAASTPEAVIEPVARPQLTAEQVAAKQTALREGIAQLNRDAERAKTPIEDRMWAKDAPLPAAELPEAVKELRNTPERRMFSPQGSFASVQLETAMKDVTLDPAVKTAVAAEYREVFADIGASTQDAQEIVDAVGRFTAEPMAPERDATNTNSAIQILNEHYGTDAKAALATAQEMIARDPRFARVLEISRLGNDPQTVLKIVQLARSAKMRGEF